MRLGRVEHLHFLGVGGVGMCALAELLAAEGHRVTGCDLRESPRTRLLAARGIEVRVGHDPAHVEGAGALVVTAAVDDVHPEIGAARRRDVPVVRRATLLAEVMRGHQGIAVAGTHGKTTTTALLGHVLVRCGLDPTVAVGGHVPDLGGYARRGRGDLMVCEADEYDRSFLKLHPAWVVVTNVEPEHLETYGSARRLEAAFAELAGRVPFYGAVAACADDPGALRVARASGRRVVTWGTGTEAWLRAVEIRSEALASRVRVAAGGQTLGELTVPLPGEHNVRNALAAVALGLELGCAFENLASAVATFRGVGRRFQVLGTRDGVTVVDDYAHHPTEVAALLGAARQAFSDRRLVVVFQPHLYSRTERFAREFGEALAAADLVLVAPLYPAREPAIPGVDAGLVARAVTAAGGTARAFDTLRAVVEHLEEELGAGDVLLTAGAGDVDQVASLWLGRDT